MAGKEFFGFALFDQAALVEDEDVIDVANGGEAVGDDEGGAPGH